MARSAEVVIPLSSRDPGQRGCRPAVVNWHLTPGCNFSCLHCFAPRDTAWEQDRGDVPTVLRNIRRMGKRMVPDAPRVRLNLAGGEPLLDLAGSERIAREAVRLGMEVSLITNGWYLDSCTALLRDLCLVGISVDSLDPETNLRIGRHHGGKTLSFRDLEARVRRIRRIQPSCRLKLNVVVQRQNKDEILIPQLLRLRPDRVKVLQVLPFWDPQGHPSRARYEITQEEFSRFLHRNGVRSGPPFVIEAGESMIGSYLIVDPKGFVCDDTSGVDYVRKLDLRDPDLSERDFDSLWLDQGKYGARYASGNQAHPVKRGGHESSGRR